jgi:hypothetical protein
MIFIKKLRNFPPRRDFFSEFYLKFLANKKKVFHKKTSKTKFNIKTNKQIKENKCSTKKPANKKRILKISKLKIKKKNKKTLKEILARPKVSKLRIGKRITFLCM